MVRCAGSGALTSRNANLLTKPPQVSDSAGPYRRVTCSLVSEVGLQGRVSPDGRAGTIAATSGLPEYAPGWTKDVEAVEALVKALSAVIGRVRERIEATGPADAVTEDLLIGLAADLEKQSWMFQAENRG